MLYTYNTTNKMNTGVTCAMSGTINYIIANFFRGNTIIVIVARALKNHILWLIPFVLEHTLMKRYVNQSDNKQQIIKKASDIALK